MTMVPCGQAYLTKYADLMNRIGGEAEEGYDYSNYYNYCTTSSSREREEQQEGDISSNNWLLLGSDLAVNRVAYLNNGDMADRQDGEPGSKQQQDSWLQLSIGGAAAPTTFNKQRVNMSTTTSTGLVELDLLPPGDGTTPPSVFQVPRPSFSNTASFFLHPAADLAGGPTSAHPHEVSWAFRHLPHPPSSYSPSLAMGMGMGSYFGRPFPLHSGSIDMAGPSSDVKVIPPPRRPHSGLWFMLQASPNQVKEPFLPQIPKSYLRIKDGRMTIRLLIKYLVNKLRLGSESEIEIRCRGQEVLPLLTLQHVRDTLWTTSPFPPNSSSHSPDHLMLLHYSRTP